MTSPASSKTRSTRALNEEELQSEPDYSKVSINDFGKAQLIGMGWTETRGIGRDGSSKTIQPVEFVGRHQRVGLGAVPKELIVNPATFLKSIQESSSIHPTGGPIIEENGKIRHFKYLDEKNTKTAEVVVQKMIEERMKPKFSNGDMVMITDGKHNGLSGVLIRAPKDSENSCIVQLQINEQNIKVPKSYIKLKGKEKSKEKEEKWLGKRESEDVKIEREENKHRNNSDSKSSVELKGNNSPKREEVSHLYHERNKSKREKEHQSHGIEWISPHLRVRIVSKSYKDGKYYNTKAIVGDCSQNGKITVMVEGSSRVVLDDLKERHLETTIPSKGGRVVVVKETKEAQKGSKGQLIERDRKEQRVHVQLVKNGKIVKLSFDEVCELAE